MITSGFFNSVSGDRKYNADHLTKYLGKLVGSGVFPNPSTNLQVMAASGMAVKVLPGLGFIDSRWMENDADYTITLEKANAVYARIDSIVMQLDLNNRTIQPVLKTGTPQSPAVAPEIVRNENIQEYRLANITVNKGVTEIGQNVIRDMRGSADCGYITGLIQQIDTETLFAQYEAAFDEWFSQVRNEVTTSTLLRQKVTRQTATSDNQKTFAFAQGREYNPDLDILEVYVDGVRKELNKDYTVSSGQLMISLNGGVPTGTNVDIIVWKSVDGYKADSVISQVEDLQERVLDMTPSKQTVTLTSTGWTLTDGYYYQTVQASILKTADDVVQVGPAPDSVEAYGSVYASEQGIGRLTFKASVKPTVNLNVNLVNFGVML